MRARDVGMVLVVGMSAAIILWKLIAVVITVGDYVMFSGFGDVNSAIGALNQLLFHVTDLLVAILVLITANVCYKK